MDTFFQDEIKEQEKNKSWWAKMSLIERSGFVAFVASLIPFYTYSGRLGVYCGVAGWSLWLSSFVAGSLWRVRHAVHFWWSLVFAGLVHASLLPTYAYLVERIKLNPGHEGKVFIYFAGGVMLAEMFTLLFLLKRAAMWVHTRHAKTPHVNDLS